MSWGRMLLLGNVGQQLDIDDIEGDVVQLRARLNRRLEAQQATDRSQDNALLTLRREVTDLQLVVAELSRLLVASGTVPADAVERIVRGLERGPAE